jgi:hypothetical protein
MGRVGHLGCRVMVSLTLLISHVVCTNGIVKVLAQRPWARDKDRGDTIRAKGDGPENNRQVCMLRDEDCSLETFPPRI